MKIGINASFARKPNTGIGQMTLNFLRKLSEFKIQNSKFKAMEFILYLEEDLPKGLKLPDNFEKRIFLPIYKRDDLIRKIWWEKCLLPCHVKKDQCDVFVSLYQCPTFMRTKHIMLVHDIIPELFPEYLNNFRKKIYWKLTRKAIRHAEKIIAVSRRTEKDLIQRLGIKPEKITVNYQSIDEIYKENISEEHKNKALKKYKLKGNYILAGGGYEVRKNVEGVIRAYHALWEKNKNLHFIHEMPKLAIYGKLIPELFPLATDAEKLVGDLNLTKQIKLLGEVSQKDLPALFSGALFFVYPSHYEGFGLPVLEAMSVGTPVIAGKNSSLPEVGGDSVLYCHSNDIHDIAMVMKNILENKDLRKALSRRGKERAENFSWDKFAQKFWNIISEYA